MIKRPLKHDFEAVLEWKGKTIAVCSRGDRLMLHPGDAVLNNIKNYNYCDIIITSSRNFATFDKVMQSVVKDCEMKIFNRSYCETSTYEEQYLNLSNLVKDVIAAI